MFTQYVPDFFQEEGEAALRSQVQWLERQIGFEDSFFAKFLHVKENAFHDWKCRGGSLPSDRQTNLRDFWRTILHLFSFLNFDDQRVRHLLNHPVPCVPPHETFPLAPPWSGSSLRSYFEENGRESLPGVDRWITAFRFGDPYAA